MEPANKLAIPTQEQQSWNFQYAPKQNTKTCGGGGGGRGRGEGEEVGGRQRRKRRKLF